MSQKNPNLVAASLVLLTSELPDVQILQSRGVNVASVVRTDVGTYEITLERAIPVGSLHITTSAHETGTGQPRHLLVERISQSPQVFRARCYNLGVPPALQEDLCFWRIVWHASPEIQPVDVALEPLNMIPP